MEHMLLFHSSFSFVFMMVAIVGTESAQTCFSLIADPPGETQNVPKPTARNNIIKWDLPDVGLGKAAQGASLFSRKTYLNCLLTI